MMIRYAYRRKLYFIVILFLSRLSIAQEVDPATILDLLNMKYYNLKNYSYNLNVSFQSITKSSGKSYSSSVYTRKRSNLDSIRDFIVVKNNQLACLSLNKHLTQIDAVNEKMYSKKIVPPYADLTKGLMTRLLYCPFVYRKNIFTLDQWVVKQKKEGNAESILECTRFVNTGFTNDEQSKENAEQKVIIEWSKTDTLIRAIYDTIYFKPNPQIWVYKFSDYEMISQEVFDSIYLSHMTKTSGFKRDNAVVKSVEINMK
ncbi:MAG: hypothetical protein IPM92_04585 [Saprospiraceae bacterium]|nr:hypothetical protein [Saprospiraceae bacterium]